MKTRSRYFILACILILSSMIAITSCDLNPVESSYKSYQITASAGLGGHVSGGDSLYLSHSTATLLATPDSNYAFTAWYEDTAKVSSNASYTFEVTEPRTLVAEFRDIHKYYCTVNMVGSNFLLVSGMGLVKGAGLHTVGDTIHLLASASEGHHFLGWYAAPDSSALVSVDSTLDLGCMGDTTLYSMFIVNLDTLTLTSDSDGVVSGTGVYDYGTLVKLIATPHVGYRFAGWYDAQGLHLSDSSTYEFLVSQTSTLEAHFSIKTYTIALPPPTAGGTVSGGGDYPYDTTITVEAHAGFGYDFQGWYNHATGGPESSDSVYSFKVTKSDTLDARFMAKPYIITLISRPAVGGLVSGGGTFPYDSTITVKAHASVGYSFAGWYAVGGRSAVSTDSVYSITVSGPSNLEAHFTAKPYTITLPPPTAGGTVSGGGDYPYDTTITVKAHTEFGYHFAGWYDHFTGLSLSTDSSYSFTVKHTSTLDARFMAKPYIITLISRPGVGGLVSGGGRFPYDSTITVKAHASVGYSFAGWYGIGGRSAVSTDSVYSITVSGPSNLEAHFTAKPYTITLPPPTAGGTVSGGGDYPYDTTITVKAHTEFGYHFAGWYDHFTGLSLSTDTSYSFTVKHTSTLDARFMAKPYIISLISRPGVGGLVSGGGTFPYDSTITVKAHASVGYSFAGWYSAGSRSAVSTDSVYSITVSGPSTLEAHFTAKPYTITLPPPTAGGTVSGGGDYPYDTTITVKAHTEFGYHFAGWYDHFTGLSLSTDTSYSFTVKHTSTLDARFMAKPYIISLISRPGVGGLVSGGGTFPYDSTITVKAHASVGYSFAGWYAAGSRSAVSTDSVYSITVSGPSTLEAHFTAKPYTITLPPPTAGGTVSGGGDYPYDTTITVKAHTEFGYHFAGWYDHFTGLSLSTDTSYSFTVKHTSTLDARFMAKPYIITLISRPGVGGLVSGGGRFPYDSTITVKAHASVGYSFEGWYGIGGRIAVSTDSVYSITVSGPSNLEAHFTAKPYTITLPPPTAGGTVSGGGDYPYDTTITVKAHTEFGYHFAGWYDHFTGLSLSTDTSYSFTVKNTSTLDARFMAKPYIISLISRPGVGGLVSGGGTFPYDSTITVKAHASVGYSFEGWYGIGGRIAVSTDSVYSITVSGPKMLEAHFTAKPYTITLPPPTAGGTVSGGGDYPYDTTITVKAHTEFGYHFAGWYDHFTGLSLSTDTSYSFTVKHTSTLDARFMAKPYIITLISNPAGGGLVSGGGTFPYDSTITVKAHASVGYSFAGWYAVGGRSAVSTDSVYSITVSGPKMLEAHFTAKPYTITLPPPTAGGTVSGGGDYPYDTTITVKAHTEFGYHFAGWYDHFTGLSLSTDTSYSFTVKHTSTLDARFMAKPYIITLISSPAVGGLVSGGGTFPYDSTITVKAHASVGYSFAGWYAVGGRSAVSTDSVYSITVSGSSTLEAHFTAKHYGITLGSNPIVGGAVSGSGSFPYDSTITVKALPNVEYSFDGWYPLGGRSAVSTDSVYSFKVSGSASLVAHFSIKTCTIALSQNSTYVSGTVSGGGDFLYGRTITVRSVSPAGYEFGSWYDLDLSKSVSRDSVYRFQVLGKRRLQARYVVAISRKHISSGTFMMGSPTTESERDPDEKQHEVTLTHDFDMSTYKITWAQYLAFCTATGRKTPSDDGFGQGDHPVTNVNWDAAVAFCTWVGEQTGIACRLPREAEWEYAAREGKNSQYHKYSGSDKIDDVAWYSRNSKNMTHPVGKKLPNKLGIYDMSGNVLEWCSDWYGDYGSNSVTDPTGPTSGPGHVLRAGNWFYGALHCRSAFRHYFFPGYADNRIGFRVVFVP